VDIQQRLLVIADIGGYTRFMLASRISLIHAQQAVTSLIEAVLDGAQGLKLAKLEGDAAFFFAPAGSAGELTAQVAEIRRRFLQRRQELVAERMCSCAGCTQLEELTLKFVAHAGEVAVHKVRGLEELSGVDVILVHRLLKNTVPVKEYLLVTEPVRAELPAEHTAGATQVEEEVEGIGATVAYWVETDTLAAVPGPTPPPAAPTKWWRKVVKELGALPYWVGLKKPTLTLD